MSSPIAPAAPAEESRVQLALAVLGALVAVAGVLGYGWPVFTILVLYWAENVFIGCANVVRMVVAAARGGLAVLGSGLFMVAFFCVHYGLFTFVHGMLVFGLFGPKDAAQPGDARELLRALRAMVAADHWLAIALLVGAVSVAADAVRWILSTRSAQRAAGAATGDDADERNPNHLGTLMAAPYGRVAVLHLTLIGGGFIAQVFGAQAVVAVLLVLLKLAFDLRRLHAPALAPVRA